MKTMFFCKHKIIRLSLMASMFILIFTMLSCIDDLGTIAPSSPTSVKVGLILPFDYQIGTKYGAELAMSEINKDGGILGVPLELVIKDNQDNPELSAKLAEELITKNKVTAIVGPNYSSNALKVAPVAQKYKVPMVATTATNPSVTDSGEFVFLSSFSDNFQGKVMANFARDSLRAQTAALLADEGDAYVVGLSQIFEDNFKALGGNIVASETYSAGDTDFTIQLTAIAAQAPDIIFMPGFVPEVPLAIKQARTIPQKGASGITATFLGGDGWEDSDLVEIAGNAIEDCYFSNLFSHETEDATARDFVQSYRSMFGITPNAAAALGYDAVKLVVTAMRRAGSVNKNAIRDELANTRGYKGATTLLDYNERRHPRKSAVIMHIQNGQVKFYKQIEP